MRLASVSARASARAQPDVAFSASGPLLFARYALAPNRLGLCGPSDWQALLEAGRVGLDRGANGVERRRSTEAERVLRRLAVDFEGAFPYLQLIAAANGISDPLDVRVVEGYWIGNDLSDRVDASLLAGSLDERFRRRTTPDAWRWLAQKPLAGAAPTHALHVLDVFPRVGLLRGGDASDTMGLMDACRIRWSRVTSVIGDALIVEASRLEMSSGKLRLGPAMRETIKRLPEIPGSGAMVQAGDYVSVHWGWACEVLSSGRLARLIAHTEAQLRVTNQTI